MHCSFARCHTELGLTLRRLFWISIRNLATSTDQPPVPFLTPRPGIVSCDDTRQ